VKGVRIGSLETSGGECEELAHGCETSVGRVTSSATVDGMSTISVILCTHNPRPDYLARLAEGTHFSSALLDQVWGEPAVPRSRGRRLLDKIRVFRTPKPHRTIQAAALRGHDRAMER